MMALVGVSAKYSIPVTKELLYPALADIIRLEPVLGVNVFRQNGKRVFRKIASVDLDQVVKFLPDQSVESFTEEFYQIKTPYDCETLPLWRVYILGRTHVLWGFNHAPFDGNCGPLFHERLVKRLGVVTASLESPVVPTAEGPIPKSLGKMLNIKPSVPWLLRLYVKEKWTKRWFPSKNQWTGRPTVRPFVSKTVIATLNPEETAALLKRSKELALSLTAILAASWIECALQDLPKDKEGATVEFDCAVNLRRHMKPENMNQFGNWVTVYPYSIKNCSSKSPGEFAPSLAKDFHNELKRNLVNVHAPMNLLVGCLSVIDVEDYVKRLRRHTAVELSNLGAKSCEGEACRVDDMIFFQTNPSASATYVLSAVSIKGGSLNLAISIALDDDKKTTANRMRELLLTTLRNV